MTDRVPPHDLALERIILGALLIAPDRIGEAVAAVGTGDFYRPVHGAIFEAIVAEWTAGNRPDGALVMRHLSSRDRAALGTPAELVSMQAEVPSTSNVARYAREIAGLASRRQLIRAAGEIAELGWSEQDPGEAVDQAQTTLRTVAVPTSTVHVDVPMLDDFVEVDDEALDWLIPGFFARGERSLMVAGEGIGKSVWMRFLAVACAQGVCPFTLRPMEPIRTLVVDLENPGRIIRKTLRPMLAVAQQQRTRVYDPDRMRVFHEPSGLDLRTRHGLSTLDAVLAKAKPDLVVLGPLYKSFRKGKGESDEDAAADVQARFDDLRTRHGFGLWLEHHAPHGSGGYKREMRPFGSSLWQRWPEFGPTLEAEDPKNRTELVWGDWRPPRDWRPWPDRVARGRGGWPWECAWDAGMPTIGEAA